MKVLLVSSSSGSHGGGEFYLALLAEGLVDLGCDVSVLMSNSANMDGLAEMIGPRGEFNGQLKKLLQMSFTSTNSALMMDWRS